MQSINNEIALEKAKNEVLLRKLRQGQMGFAAKFAKNKFAASFKNVNRFANKKSDTEIEALELEIQL